MLSRVCAVSLVLLAAACAQGTSGSDDDGDDVDARADAKVDDLVDAAGGDASTNPDAPGTVDAGIDAAPGAAPDTCAQAQDITAGAMQGNGITVTGDTTGYADDIRPTSACTEFVPDGPDAIYAVTVNAGATITAVATPTSGWDISLEIVQPCTLIPTCIGGMDFYLAGMAETLTVTAATQGTYYIAVDGYNPGVAGPFSLNVRVQ